MPLVFVYGTLMQGFENHELLRGAAFEGCGSVHGIMYNLGAYPAVVASACSPSSVYGEIYRVDDVLMKRLDHLEGHPDYYYRSTALIRTGRGESREGWIYFFPADRLGEGVLVSSGDWLLQRCLSGRQWSYFTVKEEKEICALLERETVPAAARLSEKEEVAGFLYRLTGEDILRLDELEKWPRQSCRRRVPVLTGEGEEVIAVTHMGHQNR